MKTSVVRLISISAVALAAACNRSPSRVGDDLQRDLDMASPSGVALTPANGRVDVVSAIEQGKAEKAPASAPQQHAAPHVAPKRVASAPRTVAQAPAPRPAPVRETPAPAPQEQTVIAQTPAEEPAPAPTVTPEPVPAPVPSPSRAPHGRQRGGTWTMGDVIRNAPFPINP